MDESFFGQIGLYFSKRKFYPIVWEWYLHCTRKAFRCSSHSSESWFKWRIPFHSRYILKFTMYVSFSSQYCRLWYLYIDERETVGTEELQQLVIYEYQELKCNVKLANRFKESVNKFRYNLYVKVFQRISLLTDWQKALVSVSNRFTTFQLLFEGLLFCAKKKKVSDSLSVDNFSYFYRIPIVLTDTESNYVFHCASVNHRHSFSAAFMAGLKIRQRNFIWFFSCHTFNFIGKYYSIIFTSWAEKTCKHTLENYKKCLGKFHVSYAPLEIFDKFSTTVSYCLVKHVLMFSQGNKI